MRDDNLFRLSSPATASATEPASDSAADTDANNSGPNTITNAKPDHVGQPAMLQQLGHGFWNEQVCHL